MTPLRQRMQEDLQIRRGELYGHVTQAKTLFEAVSTALDWFRSDFWRRDFRGSGAISAAFRGYQ